MRWLFLFFLIGCDDTCDHDGAGRCTGAHAMTFCEGGEWRPVECEAPTPNCAAQGFRAACIGERTGECDFATFEDRCLDEHTLEDCALIADADEAIRHRVTCPGDQLCGEAPRASLGPERPPNARFACFEQRPRTRPPAIVTFVRGDVRLRGTTPTVPFAVPTGTSLELGEGAHAVVLVKERATRLDGPGTFDVYDYQPEARVATPEAAAIERALGAEAPPPIPDDPLISPAPSAVGSIVLVVGEGVPGAASRLGTIRWRCDGECGREVELSDSSRTLWRGTGAGQVQYEGPALDAPASYTLSVGENVYEVRTIEPLVVRDLLASMREWPLAERMSVVAAIHRWRGSRSAAIATIELAMRDERSADMQALMDAYSTIR